MAWYDSTFVQTIRFLAEHTVTCSFAGLCFWLVGVVMKLVLPGGWVKQTVDTVEAISFIVLLIYFVVQMFRQLYNASKGRSNGAHPILVA